MGKNNSQGSNQGCLLRIAIAGNTGKTVNGVVDAPGRYVDYRPLLSDGWSRSKQRQRKKTCPKKLSHENRSIQGNARLI